MSESEDYLDGLLDSVASTKNEVGESEGDTMRSEEDFMKEFEQDMFSGDGEDDFLKSFEQELQDGTAGGDAAQDDMFFENIDGIVNSVKQELEGSQEPLKEEAAPVEEKSTEEQSLAADGDQDLMDLLQSEEGLSDIGDMLNADDNHETLDDSGIEDFAESEMSEASESQEGAEEEEKPKKEGFFAKLGRILFGEDDEEEEEKKPAEKVSLAPSAMPDIDNLSDENLQILQTLSGEGEAEPQADAPQEETEEEKKAKKKEEKEKKKKEKQEAKEKKKKEKQEKKDKKPKKEKVKKEKPPKEPDRTPPLPKVPVILIFVMAGSFFALVMIATNLMGYSNSFLEAESAYSNGEYELAYQQLSGMEIKEADLAEYQKYKIMATISGEYYAYESLMQGEIYDMALDSLVRTVGRCEKYREDAAVYECAENLENIKTEAVNALAAFGIGEEEALSLYNVEDRSEYSKEVYRIIKAAGLEKVTEE